MTAPLPPSNHLWLRGLQIWGQRFVRGLPTFWRVCVISYLLISGFPLISIPTPSPPPSPPFPLETESQNTSPLLPTLLSWYAAGELAGLRVLRMIPEPSAAALAYGVERRTQRSRRVLVYDLGGGTFDVTLADVQGSTVEVRGIGGNSHLGGRDFDQRVLEHVLQVSEHGQNTVPVKSIRSLLSKQRFRLKLC